MSAISENNKCIAKNTLFLYVRMLLIMIVTLYTSRVVLRVLGVEDFGIYNVVGGVVTMFSILSGSLSAAISRFITFELGSNNQERLKAVFSSSIMIQWFLAMFIIVLAEILGVWFLNHKMNIAQERLFAANWVLQCSIATFAVNLISVPYNAAIIAHERMQAFAYVSVIEAFLKLAAVYLLSVSLCDKLIVYAILLLGISLIIRLIYGVYCGKNFAECHFHFTLDKGLLKEMISFAGWNFIGASSGVLRGQGVNILLNLFCGPTVNAARGIAAQVNTAVQSFANNFMTALNPQITKSYATGNRSYMLSLLYQGARFSFYMLFFLSLPLLIETEMVLRLWLYTVPDYTIIFVRLILILALSESLSAPLITAMLATGDIKNYQLVVGGLQMLNFPISYLFLCWGASPDITFIIAIVISQFCLLARLLMLRGMIGLPFWTYLQKVYLNVFKVGSISTLFPLFIYTQIPMGFQRFLLMIIASSLSILLVVFYIGCTADERIFIRNKIGFIRDKFLRK